MNSSKRVGEWRPLLGVAIVGALALGVSALAAPRGADQAVRGTVKGGTEVTRLVTGAPEQINAVIAGGPAATAILAITPVPAKVGAYPAGTTIVGNTLSSDAGGFRIWLEVQLSNWDPNGDDVPPLKTFQIKQDCAGYMSGKGDPLGNPIIPCIDATRCTAAGVPDACCTGAGTGPTCAGVGNTFCRTTFGEVWAKCETVSGACTCAVGVVPCVPAASGLCTAGNLVGNICTTNADCAAPYCKPGYLDKGGTNRPADNYCAGGCDAGDVATATCNYNFFSVYNATRSDGGIVYYGGTEVLDIPAAAKGMYCVELAHSDTFLADTSAPPADIPTAQENGYCVNIRTGSCCYGLGQGPPVEGCSDNQTVAECNAAASPHVWTENKLCAAGCVECTIPGNDPLCNDNDACTTESCNAALGLCVRGNIAGYPAAGICCNPANGNLASNDDGIECTDDSCSADPQSGTPRKGNGVPAHTPSSPVTPCDDNNPCSVGDHCGGPPSVSCTGTDVNTIPCVTSADCPLDPAGTAYACVDGLCFCTLTPIISFEIPVGERKTCDGGPRDGLPCTSNTDCAPLGVCDNYADGANCFDDGEKITAVVHIGASGSPVNGGQFLIQLDLGGCFELQDIDCLAPYTNTVYGPIVNEGNDTIFIACGVDAFAGVDGPFGGVDILSLSVTKVGDCSECSLCFGNINPQHTYLVDDAGQRIDVEPRCKSVKGDGELVLTVPDNIKTNADCDGPTAVETWASPTASFSCGTASITCRGAHESGLSYNMTKGPNGYLDGGEFPSGSSSFCCYATANDACDATAGCAGSVNDCAIGSDGKPEGCWTVEVNDETSLDIEVQLCPPLATTGELTRCIKFCLYGSDCAQEPSCFSEDVTFGGLFNFVGKSRGKIKVPGTTNWGCITAQDQLHTLRSCYTFGAGDCDEGQLHAQFSGAPEFDGNGHCLIGGNLDGWKKDIAGSNPSLDVIDILDYGTFISQYGVNYGTGDTPCPAVDHGPNADINGDGSVTMADYSFVLRNFLVSAKDCCCGPQASSLPPALAEVTVDELNQMGLGDLAVGDLNGDGVLNADDMDAFMQGARPVKAHDRKGGKGLRSGR